MTEDTSPCGLQTRGGGTARSSGGSTMIRRSLILFVALGALSGMLLPAASQASTGPTLQVSQDLLGSALSCPASFSGAHEPVLLVHGTAGSREAWSWNYVKVLSSHGYDVCAVTLPDY